MLQMTGYFVKLPAECETPQGAENENTTLLQVGRTPECAVSRLGTLLPAFAIQIQTAVIGRYCPD